MAKFKALPIAAAVAAGLLSLASGAQAADNNGWTVGGYGKFKYDIGESYAREYTWEQRRDMRAGGPFFSANVNQVEFTLKKSSEYKNGVWANYVLRTEYGNNEGGNGQPFYGSSSGNEGHLETGQLEFKEAYVELGALSVLPKDGSIWAGRRFLNRQQGLISKEFWKQSSGVGAGFAMGNMGLALISADPGEGSCGSQNCKNNNVTPEGRTTLNSLDAYLYSVKLTDVMKLDFDVKYHWRANDDQLGNVGLSKSAKDGAAVGVMLSANYYGLPGWSVTAINYGEGIATNRGMNFGQWDGAWGEDDSAIFFTHNGVWTINNTFQLGTEIAYWDIDFKSEAWGQDSVARLFLGVTPSIKINDNFRLEFIGTAAQEALEDGSAWGRKDDAEWFYTATFAPVFTVNADYFGRPQIKPYVTYMTSTHDGMRWLPGANDESDVVYGIEAEIWF